MPCTKPTGDYPQHTMLPQALAGVIPESGVSPENLHVCPNKQKEQINRSRKEKDLKTKTLCPYRYVKLPENGLIANVLTHSM